MLRGEDRFGHDSSHCIPLCTKSELSEVTSRAVTSISSGLFFLLYVSGGNRKMAVCAGTVNVRGCVQIGYELSPGQMR